jgi:hypothetical protein
MKKQVAVVWRNPKPKGIEDIWLCKLFDSEDPTIRDFIIRTGAYEQSHVAMIVDADPNDRAKR